MNQKFFPWKPLILSGAFLTALTACSSGEGALDLLPETDAVEIRLSGDIGSLTGSADTRGAIDKDHPNPMSVRFARLDQNVDGFYPDYTTAVPLPATRAGGSGQTSINFSNPQYYLTREDNNNTKLVGWTPVGGGYELGKVAFGISTGITDVMLTSELTGSKNFPFGPDNSFVFKHLLTKVTVKAYGDIDNVANEAWGNVQSVKVKDQPVMCIVTLPGTAANDISWIGSTKIALNNSKDFPMGDVSLVDKTTSSNTANCGYAMFRPTSDNNLTLIVETEKGGVREVLVTAPEGSSTFAAGKAYTITLQFKSTIIAPKASISAWTSGGNVNVDL